VSDDEVPRSPFENVDLYRDYTGVKAQGTVGNGDPQAPSRSALASFEKQGENGPLKNQVMIMWSFVFSQCILIRGREGVVVVRLAVVLGVYMFACLSRA
jgi:hypothetical protein